MTARQTPAEAQAAHRARTIERYQRTADAAPDAAGVVAASLRLHEALRPHLPTGGGFLLGDAADRAAELIVHELRRCGWLVDRQGELDLGAAS